MGDPCGGGNVLYLNCIHDNILVMISYYCYHWGGADKVYIGPLYTIYYMK